MVPKTICLINANIENISDIPLSDNIHSINMHFNRIRLIEPGIFPNSLTSLDLSSNLLTTFCCDEKLRNLKRLNLSANHLKTVKDFQYLSSLVDLNLSYNQLMNLSSLRGVCNHPLSCLDIRGNRLSSIDDLITDLSEMKCLTELFVSDEPLTVDDNPICTLVGFRVTLLEGLPQTLKVDSYSREVPSKNPSILHPDALVDLKENKAKYSCGIQTESETVSHYMELPSPRTLQCASVQVSFDKQEKRRLALQITKLTKELELERNFRAKSEAFQECLIKKLEALSERSDNQNSDLVLNNVKLKERLADEAQNRSRLEEWLQRIYRQLHDSSQGFDDVVTLVIEAMTRLEAEAVTRETTLKKVLLKAEKQNVKKAVQDKIARVCKEVRRQANCELEAARERYSQLEAEFRFALYSEGQRYNQLFTRATTAEKALQEQGEELHATRENLNLATALVHSLKKTIEEQRTKLCSSDRSLSGAKDLLGEMNKTIKQLTMQLSVEKAEKSRILETYKLCCDRSDLIAHLKEENKKLQKLQGEVSSNNSTLSIELNDLTTKLKSAEESVRIKTIQLDDQLDTIKRLKSDLNAERDRSKEMTKVEEQNKKLQSAVDHLADRKDELKSLLLQVESENSCLKDEILAQQEEINCIKEGFCCKEGDWLRRCSQAEKERDVAVGKMREMAEEMKEVERSCQNRLESMEIALNEQEREANQRLLETQAAANQRIHELEQEMRQILLESMSLRERVEATVKHLAGELSYQGD